VNAVLVALSRTRIGPHVGLAMLSLLDHTARALSVQMGRHRTKTTRPVRFALQDSLAQEGHAIAVTLALSRQVTEHHARRAREAMPVRAGSANSALLDPSRTAWR